MNHNPIKNADDLRALVIALGDEIEDAEPGAVTAAVLAELSGRELRVALDATMHGYVVAVLRAEAAAALHDTEDAPAADHSAHDTRAGLVGGGDEEDTRQATGAATPTVSPPAGSSVSRKVLAWQQRALDKRYRAGTNGWKRHLGDMTADDLDAMADDREKRAGGLLREADKWRELAKTMRALHVEHVRDVPADTLHSIVKGEAAA